jgi:hypothetical protein
MLEYDGIEAIVHGLVDRGYIMHVNGVDSFVEEMQHELAEAGYLSFTCGHLPKAAHIDAAGLCLQAVLICGFTPIDDVLFGKDNWLGTHNDCVLDKVERYGVDAHKGMMPSSFPNPPEEAQHYLWVFDVVERHPRITVHVNILTACVPHAASLVHVGASAFQRYEDGTFESPVHTKWLDIALHLSAAGCDRTRCGFGNSTLCEQHGSEVERSMKEHLMWIAAEVQDYYLQLRGTATHMCSIANTTPRKSCALQLQQVLSLDDTSAFAFFVLLMDVSMSRAFDVAETGRVYIRAVQHIVKDLCGSTALVGCGDDGDVVVDAEWAFYCIRLAANVVEMMNWLVNLYAVRSSFWRYYADTSLGCWKVDFCDAFAASGCAIVSQLTFQQRLELCESAVVDYVCDVSDPWVARLAVKRAAFFASVAANAASASTAIATASRWSDCDNQPHILLERVHMLFQGKPRMDSVDWRLHITPRLRPEECPCGSCMQAQFLLEAKKLLQDIGGVATRRESTGISLQKLISDTMTNYCSPRARLAVRRELLPCTELYITTTSMGSKGRVESWAAEERRCVTLFVSSQDVDAYRMRLDDFLGIQVHEDMFCGD